MRNTGGKVEVERGDVRAVVRRNGRRLVTVVTTHGGEVWPVDFR